MITSFRAAAAVIALLILMPSAIASPAHSKHKARGTVNPQAKVERLLTRAFGLSSVRSVAMAQGADAPQPVKGWIALIGLNGSPGDAKLMATKTVNTALRRDLGISRVTVTIYPKGSEEATYILEADRGKRPTVLQDIGGYTP